MEVQRKVFAYHLAVHIHVHHPLVLQHRVLQEILQVQRQQLQSFVCSYQIPCFVLVNISRKETEQNMKIYHLTNNFQKQIYRSDDHTSCQASRLHAGPSPTMQSVLSPKTSFQIPKKFATGQWCGARTFSELFLTCSELRAYQLSLTFSELLWLTYSSCSMTTLGFPRQFPKPEAAQTIGRVHKMSSR